MFWQRFDKVITVFILITAVSVAGAFIVRQKYTDETHVYIPMEDKTKSIRVTVSGYVENPGQYAIKEGSHVSDAIYSAGGVSEGADTDAINLAAVLTDGSDVVVPGKDGTTAPKGIKVVNINTASFEEFCDVPGIGETLAQRIVQYRKSKGKIKDVAELKNIKGIGDKSFEKLKVYFVTEEPRK